MKKERKEITVGDWQVDETGRRYRKVGDCIEYAMQITTTHGTMYADELQNLNKHLQEQPAPVPEKPKTIDKLCPLKAFKGGMNVKCDVNCTFYNGTGCRFGGADPERITDTKNKNCPFVGKCSDGCALYQSGCTIKF